MVSIYDEDVGIDLCDGCRLPEELCECSLMLSPQQRDFFWDERRWLVYIGGRGTGKTTAACARLIGMIERGDVRNGARIVVFGPTYPQMKKGTIKSFDKWFGKAGLIIQKIDGNEPERRLVNDITVYFRNASNPDQTRGHEVQIVWLDEVAQMDEGVMTLTNAACRQFGNNAMYQTLLTSTPRGRNWLYRWFKDPATQRYRPDQFGLYTISTTEAQKHGVVREGYIEEMGYIPGSDMWKQEVEAQFLTWGGMVFDRFNPERHCPDPFVLPDFQTVYGGVDPGYSGTTSMHLSGITKAGAIYTFKEYYRKRATPHEWMAVCAEWTRQHKVKAWYVDAAADGEIRAMKAAGLRVRPSMKAKDAAGTAVSFINGKFQEHELFIDRKTCPYLVGEIESYQYKEVLTGDEVTFLGKVKPNQADHACFAAETVVMTDQGDRRIDRIRSGDRVLTRAGYRTVLGAGMTDPDAEVFDVRLDNDEVVTATATHPFWVEGQGWTPVRQLMPGDTLLSCPEWSPSSSTASPSGAIPIPHSGPIASITRPEAETECAAPDGFTRKSGRRSTVLSRRDITSTTQTSTSPITAPITSSASRPRAIATSIWTAGGREAVTTNNWPIWDASGRSQRHGTPPMKDASGTASTRETHGPAASPQPATANTADERSAQRAPAPRSVPTTARQRRDTRAASMTLAARAPSAAQGSRRIDTAPGNAVPVRVVAVSPAGRAPVYNLTVFGPPEFYANGVLVHNCDSWRYHLLPLVSHGAQKTYGAWSEFRVA